MEAITYESIVGYVTENWIHIGLDHLTMSSMCSSGIPLGCFVARVVLRNDD
jgi:hypothetical protein